MSSIKYRPDIDGLRSVAVLGVVFYHAGLGFPGGFVGVDVFFVISGYLITSLIQKELQSECFSMVNFWARRARRILPALAAMVAAVLVCGWFLMLPADFETLGKQTLALIFFSSNIKFWMESGYFDSLASEKPLLHTWSLSLEEQFYVLIPILLGLLFKFRKAAWAVPVLLLLSLASFVLSVYWTRHLREAAFYLLPSRGWELGVGSLLAFCKPISRLWVRNAMAWVGIIAILAAFLFYSSHTPFPGLGALPPVAGAALLIWSGKGFDGSGCWPIPNRWLSLRPFVFVGLISYSLYLWHWPLFAFAKYSSIKPLGNGLALGLLLASFLLAWISYRFVEQPIRNRQILRTNRQVFCFSAAVAGFLFLVSLGLWATDGYPKRLPVEAVNFAKGKDDWSTRFGGDTKIEEIPDRLTRLGNSGSTPEVFVWGDSHAMAILPAVDAACKKLGIGALASKSSSSAPVVGWQSRYLGQGEETMKYNQAVLEAIQKLSSKGGLHTVILAARWSGYSNGHNLEFNLALRKTVDEITQSGCRVVILHEVPNFPFEAPKALALAKMHGENLDELVTNTQSYEEKFAPYLKNWTELAKENDKVEIFNPGPLFAEPDGIIAPYDSDGVLYRDSHHLTTHGSMRLKEEFSKILSEKSSKDQNP
jgi:peptidoglycan/LPS O-acetylase OafA/YrhL